MSTQSAQRTKRQRDNMKYLLTSAMHRLEIALSDDPTPEGYVIRVDHRLAHILGKLDTVWQGDRQTIIDKTRTCIETNSPNETIKSHLLSKLAGSQAA